MECQQGFERCSIFYGVATLPTTCNFHVMRQGRVPIAAAAPQTSSFALPADTEYIGGTSLNIGRLNTRVSQVELKQYNIIDRYLMT